MSPMREPHGRLVRRRRTHLKGMRPYCAVRSVSTVRGVSRADVACRASSAAPGEGALRTHQEMRGRALDEGRPFRRPAGTEHSGDRETADDIPSLLQHAALSCGERPAAYSLSIDMSPPARHSRATQTLVHVQLSPGGDVLRRFPPPRRHATPMDRPMALDADAGMAHATRGRDRLDQAGMPRDRSATPVARRSPRRHA